MMKKCFYICLIVMFCVMPLFGCDSGSTPSTPGTQPSGDSKIIPADFTINAGICTIPVYSADDNGKQDFEMTITCFKQEWFHIQIDNSDPMGGGADGVDVDVFGRDFLNWGTLK